MLFPHRPRVCALALAITLLTACASSLPPVPTTPLTLELPRKLHVVRAGEPASDAILIVQADGRGTRWSLFDPLGAPRARQILQDGQWRNDGFAPPNDAARGLFAALIFAWTPATELAARYGQANVRLDSRGRALTMHGRDLIAITQGAAGELHIRLDDGASWRVSPLKETP